MKGSFLILFLLAYTFETSAQKIELEGNYQGKNLYIQNPATAYGNGCCTDSVLVNGKKITFNPVNAYEIKFDSLGLAIGEKIKLEIFHQPDCKPKVLNNNESPKVTFDLVSISIDPSGLLRWTCKNEVNKLPFTIEQFRWNKWIKVGELDGAGGSGENTYSFQTSPHSGENQFRIKQTVSDSPRISKSVDLNMPDLDVQILGNKDKQWEAIHFNKKTMYELWGEKGNLMKKGEGSNIGIKGLPKGMYYLNFDNKLEAITISSK